MEQLLKSLELAWEQLPMPAIFLYLIALGMLWLFVEYLTTRTARAVPGWRRPLPVLPWISEFVVWGVRASSWAMWIWAFVYMALVAGILLQDMTGNHTVYAALAGPVRTLHDAYALIAGYLPGVVAGWLPGV